MFIIVHYSQNTFTVLKVSNFTIFYQKKYIFGKGQIIKAPAGFELVTLRFVVNAPTHCAMLFGTNLFGGGIIKIMLDFIVYFYRKYVNMEVSHNIRMHGVRIVFPS